MHRLRFSLRTLLILTFLLAIPFAWLAVEMRESSRQRAVVKELEQAGATVLFQDGIFCHVRGVCISRCQDADQIIEWTGSLPDVTEVYLQSSEFSNDALQHWANHPKLERIDLKWTSINDEGLKHLSTLPNLRSLKLNKLYPTQPSANIDPEQISDRGVAHLSNVKHLEKLIVWGANVTDASLQHLSRCSELKTLWLLDTKIQGDGIPHLCKLPNLEKLNLGGTGVTAADIEPLKQLAGLKSLSVARTAVTQQQAIDFYSSRSGTFSIGY